MTTKKKRERDLQTAYHEAGHAVASRLTEPRTRFKYVTINPDPDKDTLGHCASEWGKNFQPDVEMNKVTRERVEAHVISLYAGGNSRAKIHREEIEGI